MMVIPLRQDVGENHFHFLPLKTDTAQCEAKGFGMQLIVKMQAPMHTRMEVPKEGDRINSSIVTSSGTTNRIRTNRLLIHNE